MNICLKSYFIIRCSQSYFIRDIAGKLLYVSQNYEWFEKENNNANDNE